MILFNFEIPEIFTRGAPRIFFRRLTHVSYFVHEILIFSMDF
ncbi:hypothetical protein LEP1GSC073_4268 [Leptospira noguchii str. Cascata]|uniref:Uncharacterized protein n=1 Tax=Leptospira noguchii serovar Panama str. CZ214 TaxID=1001595 RepID=T0GVT8_9LEPT|nr:hypothetical protein LEP1GSC072_2182 [Leptospira noguchii str. Bonito]EMS86523.1 hypothetical protein LEP1GSC073_4268 [Leptospira noguchii str. Cascata]EQA73042.1 hypothetical protein LEP1GSC059_1451 [Leptospira noguchii serovar Panama str. CZ214]